MLINQLTGSLRYGLVRANSEVQRSTRVRGAQALCNLQCKARACDSVLLSNWLAGGTITKALGRVATAHHIQPECSLNPPGGPPHASVHRTKPIVLCSSIAVT